MLPDLPMPTMMIFPRLRSTSVISSTPAVNWESSWARTAFTAASSMSNTLRALARWFIPRALFAIGIRAKHLHEVAFAAEFGNGIGDAAIFVMAIAIDEEEIFPGFALARATLDLGHVELEAAEWRQRSVQGTDFVRDAEHDACAVATRRWTALTPQNKEARHVRGTVLDVGFENIQLISFSGQGARDGGCVFLFRSEIGRARGRRCLDDFNVWQIILDPVAALRQRLRMRVKLLDLLAGKTRDQALLNGHDHLRDDLEIAIHEHIERVRDHPFGRILNWHHSVIRAIAAHFRKNVGNRLLRGISQARSETANRGLVRESGFGAEEGDRHRLLDR